MNKIEQNMNKNELTATVVVHGCTVYSVVGKKITYTNKTPLDIRF